MKKLSRTSRVALFSTALIAGTAVAVPVMNATTITAKAALTGASLNANTKLATSSSYTNTAASGLTPGDTSNGLAGSFTVSNTTLAQLQLGLASVQKAQVQIPQELAGLVTPTGNSTVNVVSNWNLFNLPAPIGGTNGYLTQLANLGNSQIITLLNQWQKQGLTISLNDLVSNPILQLLPGLGTQLKNIQSTIASYNSFINTYIAGLLPKGTPLPTIDLNSVSVNISVNVSDLYQALVDINQLESLGNSTSNPAIQMSNGNTTMSVPVNNSGTTFIQNTLTGVVQNLQNALNKLAITTTVKFPSSDFNLQQSIIDGMNTAIAGVLGGPLSLINSGLSAIGAPQINLADIENAFTAPIAAAVPSGTLADWIDNGVTIAKIQTPTLSDILNTLVPGVDFSLIPGVSDAINAMNALSINFPGVTIPGINTVLNGYLIKPITNQVSSLLDQLKAQIPNIGNTISLAGDVSLLNSVSVQFPTNLNPTQSWYEKYAPNGYVGTFTGGLTATGVTSVDVFGSDQTKDVYFKDVVPPVLPQTSDVTSNSVKVMGENASVIKVTDANGNVLGSANESGTIAKNAQAPLPESSVTVSYSGAKPGEVLNVTSTDAAGNVSQVATITVPSAPTTPTKPTPPANKPTKPSTPAKPSKPAVKAIPVYRAYNPNSGEHLYTTSEYEYNTRVSDGWRREGIEWYAPSSGAAVYRLYNPHSGEHFYTTSSYEYNSVAKSGWNKEGLAFYSATTKNVPIYREFNPNAKGPGSHFYTTSAFEYNSVASAGWRKEGIGLYALAK